MGNREELTLLFSDCYSIDGSVCKLHPVFQPQKAINKLFELGYRKLSDRPTVCQDCPTFEQGCEGSNQEDCGRQDRPELREEALRIIKEAD
ncbi:hypothetical protein LCGC14_2695880, partial [marine sediment metagenome]